jgi:hypothetical protein
MAISKVGLTTAVTGTLPVANGGTNLTSGFENGGLVHINTQTVSTAVSYINFDNQLSSTYDTYIIYFQKLGHNNAGTGFLKAQLGTGSTPTYDTGDVYQYGFIYLDAESDGTNTVAGSSQYTSGTGFIKMGLSSRSSEHNGSIILTGMNETGAWMKGIESTVFAHDQYENTFEMAKTTAVYNNSSAATSIRFYFSAGSIDTGVMTLYGVSKT